MSRISDLIELIQSANDAFLVNPKRNTRFAFIQIDNLCELAMKSWLQIDTTNRQLDCLNNLKNRGLISNNRQEKALKAFFSGGKTQIELETALGISTNNTKKEDLDSELIIQGHLEGSFDGFLLDWDSQNESGQYKNFEPVIDEIKARRPISNDGELHDILDRFSERRTVRNQFFHNQELSGLYVNENQCLHAFLDLYKLMLCLFGHVYEYELNLNQIAKAQIALMKLKCRSENQTVVFEHYRQILQLRGKLEISPLSLGYDLCFLYEDPETFIEMVRNHFNNQIFERKAKLDEINGLKRKSPDRKNELVSLQRQVVLLEEILQDCLG